MKIKAMVLNEICIGSDISAKFTLPDTVYNKSTILIAEYRVILGLTSKILIIKINYLT